MTEVIVVMSPTILALLAFAIWASLNWYWARRQANDYYDLAHRLANENAILRGYLARYKEAEGE